MNAILKYPGGKWRIADWIISKMLEHKVYLEPYFGSGAVFFNKPPACIETVNDLNGDIVNLFRVCREQPEELCKLIELTPDSREEYVACYEHSQNPVEQARRTLVRYHQSFGTSNSSKNSWRNSQTYNSPRIPLQWAQLPDIISASIERLRYAQIECMPAIELIDRYDSPDTLIYVDPPYMPDIRKRNLYRKEMKVQDHEELLEHLKTSKSKIILSAYDNTLYNSVLKDWETAEINTIVQMGLHRTEKLYMNYAPQQAQINIFELTEVKE